MLEHEKIKIVSEIGSEDNLRISLIIPLLRKMGFANVLDNQSSREFGVDVIIENKNELERTVYSAIVLKKGDISQRAGMPNSIMKTITEQVQQAWEYPLSHPELSERSTYAERVWVVTNGKISRNAKEYLESTCRKQSSNNRSLEVIDQKTIVRMLDIYWPEFYDDQRPFLSQYQKKLSDDLLGIDFSSIGHGVKKNLNDIFIDPKLEKIKDLEEVEQFSLDLNEEKITCEDFLKSKYKISFVFSSAGGGKSVLLKRIAMKKASRNHEVPILIQAKKFADKEVNVLSLCNESLKKYSDLGESQPINKLESENLYLLIDGLDEISSISDRIFVLNRIVNIKNEIKNFDVRVLVSSRHENNKEALSILSQFPCFDIVPMKETQIANFFIKWFGNKTAANKLMSSLEDKLLLEKLPKTPMAMTLLAIVYENKEDLPSNITTLYGMFTELLLGKWDQYKKINDVSEPRIKGTFLSELAWYMQSEGTEEISQDKLIDFTEDFFINNIGESKRGAQNFIQGLFERSGLITVSDKGNVRFQHLSFQEYFCAKYITNRGIIKENINEWYGNEWWSEVLFFGAGLMESIDTLIEDLTKFDKNDEHLIGKICTLGAMLQSGFTTKHKNKVSSVSKAAQLMPFVISELLLYISREKKNAPRFAVVGGLTQMFVANYSSWFLKAALNDAYKKSYEEKNFITQFCIAASLSRSGDVNLIEDFATNPELVDPSLIILSDITIKDYMSIHKDEGLSKTVRKINKKIKKFRSALHDDIMMPTHKRKDILIDDFKNGN